MKKLNKLQINPEQLMKDEELAILRGGYDVHCEIYYADYNWGSGNFASQEACDDWVDTYFDPDNYCSCP